MKKRRELKIVKRILAVLIVMCCFASMIMPSVNKAQATGSILPATQDNLNIGLRSESYLVATSSGYMRVYYDGNKIGIEYYDNNFNILRKKSINMELSIWGGFYAGSNAYYIVEGQDNTAESDTAEVVRVIKYDTNWNKKGTAKITSNTKLFGGEVRYPFDCGCVEMTEHDGTLYIVTGHEGYVDPTYNQGHQGFLMITVDEASMTGQIADCDLWHSFAQYITCKGSNLYVLEQSEGSRYTKLSRYNTENLNSISIPVLEYGGSHTSAWAISCYASVDGMALSSDNVLCLGTSIDQSDYDNVSSDTAHNIYLTVTPMSDFSEDATTVKWLTNYSGNGKSFLGTKITKINDNRFMVSWEEYETSQTASIDDGLSSSILHYVFIDGKGTKVSREFTAAAPISDCKPVVKGSKIVYYASNANMVDFYSIDAATGAFSKKVYRIAGENATWKLRNGVLTISGTGAISVDTEANYRDPVSSVSGWLSYSSGDNAWKPIREKVKKIVIEKGITSIPDNAFKYFDSLTEVQIEPGLKRIGKEAFYSCDSLSKIIIPASVTNIGEDFLWTGYTWIGSGGHVTRATICAPDKSYAIKYAKKNNISYNINTISDSTATISGIKTSYAYSGKAIKPNVTVKLNGIKLKNGTDYKVSYSNNIRTGTATVKIKGINDYSGTVTKTFKIVPKKETVLKLTSPKSRTIKVTWEKDTRATGYQIQYARNTKFTRDKKTITITKKSTVTKTISKLSKNKKYYVRIRAYKQVGSRKYYGIWSKAKSVKCK
ncbi:MAG: leucine-rich repeat protein [Coprococcus sp.]